MKTCENCTKYYDCKVSNGPDDYCSRFKSKAKRGVIGAVILLVLFVLVLWLCGCNAPITLYPLEGDHIVNVKKGEEFTAPREGYFLSNEYLKKVLKAKVKEF